MATARSNAELDKINALEERIAAIRQEIQSITAQGLTTGAALPVLKRKRKETLQVQLKNLLEKLRSLKHKPTPSPKIEIVVEQPPSPPPSVNLSLNAKDFLSKIPISNDEKEYYDKCKNYYHITNKPLISIANEILDKNVELTSSSIFKLGIDENFDEFDLQRYLDRFCQQMNLTKNDIVIRSTQQGSVIITLEIFGHATPEHRKRGLNLIFTSCNDTLQNELGKMKTFFMFLGPENALMKMQKHQAQILMNPQFNRIYAHGHNFWLGSIQDGKHRGNQPYFCPVGWKRWSFYICDNFDEKFNGWCICYHGTKFNYGLSILFNGMKPAQIKALGDGIYTTPSIIYASHPRYAEIMPIPLSARTVFKSGQYIQYVLECRIRPSSIKTIGCETLNPTQARIDPNIPNQQIEWVIDNQNQTIVDFNDPNSPIVCTGLMIRVTDDHPGLLPESQWWFQSRLCSIKTCCYLGIDLTLLQQKQQNESACQIVFD